MGSRARDLTQTKIIFSDSGNLTQPECRQGGQNESDLCDIWVLVHNHVDLVPLHDILGFLKIWVCPNSPLNFIFEREKLCLCYFLSLHPPPPKFSVNICWLIHPFKLKDKAGRRGLWTWPSGTASKATFGHSVFSVALSLRLTTDPKFLLQRTSPDSQPLCSWLEHCVLLSLRIPLFCHIKITAGQDYKPHWSIGAHHC